jgi:hypothetical protein
VVVVVVVVVLVVVVMLIWKAVWTTQWAGWAWVSPLQIGWKHGQNSERVD